MVVDVDPGAEWLTHWSRLTTCNSCLTYTHGRTESFAFRQSIETTEKCCKRNYQISFTVPTDTAATVCNDVDPLGTTLRGYLDGCGPILFTPGCRSQGTFFRCFSGALPAVLPAGQPRKSGGRKLSAKACWENVVGLLLLCVCVCLCSAIFSHSIYTPHPTHVRLHKLWRVPFCRNVDRPKL